MYVSNILNPSRIFIVTSCISFFFSLYYSTKSRCKNISTHRRINPHIYFIFFKPIFVCMMNLYIFIYIAYPKNFKSINIWLLIINPGRKLIVKQNITKQRKKCNEKEKCKQLNKDIIYFHNSFCNNNSYNKVHKIWDDQLRDGNSSFLHW